MQYFIEYDPVRGFQTISVRGTANLANAREDADYLQSKNDKSSIYLHKDFDHDAVLVYRDLLPHLKPNVKVRLTGHSLGPPFRLY